MKCQKIHFEKAILCTKLVYRLSEKNGNFGIYPVRGVLFCRFAPTLSLCQKLMGPPPLSIIMSMPRVPVMCGNTGEFSSYPV